MIDDLIAPIPNNVNHVTADSVYDANKTYQSLQEKFSPVDIVIPPKRGSIYYKNNESRTLHEPIANLSGAELATTLVV